MSAEGSSLESIVEPEGLIRFLKHPCWTGSIVHPTAGSFIILLILYFLLTIPLSFLAQVMSATLDLSNSATELDWTQRVIRGILLGPLVEELLFRLIYVFTRRNLAVIIGTSLVLLLVFLFRASYVKVVLFAIVILFGSILLLTFEKSKQIYYGRFRFFFFLLAGAFALMHLFNFQGITLLRLMPALFIVLPQLILGTILGYVRLTYGFFYGLLFHLMVNSPLLLP